MKNKITLGFILSVLACGGIAYCGEIQQAAERGDLAKVSSLLQANPDLISNADANGWTPLHCAAAHGYPAVVQFLLAHQAAIDAKTKNGETPLLLATLNCQNAVVEVAELLLTNKAEINMADSKGRTPLHHAADKGDKKLVELLLANKANVNATDHFGAAPLDTAALMGHKDIVELLIDNKAEVNCKDNNGDTPLHYAAINSHKEVVELLLANKADVNAKDNNGRTPLDCTVNGSEENKTAVKALLREHGGIE